jgi:hypothetical protein
MPPKRAKRPRDPNQLAKLIVDLATGYAEGDKSIPESQQAGRDKKAENHAYAAALQMTAYDFVRIHGSLRRSPATAVGVSKTLWDIVDALWMTEEWEAKAVA